MEIGIWIPVFNYAVLEKLHFFAHLHTCGLIDLCIFDGKFNILNL